MGYGKLKFYTSNGSVSAKEIALAMLALPENTVVSEFVDFTQKDTTLRMGGFIVEHPSIVDGTDLEPLYSRKAFQEDGHLKVINVFRGLS